jgi:hypothetical protein
VVWAVIGEPCGQELARIRALVAAAHPSARLNGKGDLVHDIVKDLLEVTVPRRTSPARHPERRLRLPSENTRRRPAVLVGAPLNIGPPARSYRFILGATMRALILTQRYALFRTRSRWAWTNWHRRCENEAQYRLRASRWSPAATRTHPTPASC